MCLVMTPPPDPAPRRYSARSKKIDLNQDYLFFPPKYGFNKKSKAICHLKGTLFLNFFYERTKR